jgi:LEA14-like dessication related protein
MLRKLNGQNLFFSVSRIVVLVLLAFLVNSCSSLRESIKARELLGKCKYELKEVRLRTFEAAPIIYFSNSDKKINVNQPSLKDLLQMADQIRKGQFKFELKELSFDALVEIQNPNAKSVELDSMFYDFFLDDAYLMKIGHFQHSLIPAESNKTTTMTAQVPLSLPVNALLTAKEATVSGKVWLKLNMSKNKQITVPVPVKLTREIPRDKINAAIEKEKQKLIKQLVQKMGKNSKVDKVKNDVKKLLGF